MPKSTLAGHPLHPMLIVAPAALIPFGFILDAMHRATDNDTTPPLPTTAWRVA